MGLLTQSNEQYYASQQVFVATAAQTQFAWTGGADRSNSAYGVNLIPFIDGVSMSNFEVYINNVKIDQGSGAGKYQVSSTNTITLGTGSTLNDVVKILLKDIKAGKWNNHDTYQYVSIRNIINNFKMAYVGDGKLINRVNRADIIFHAKRSLQEFSYDTLKSTRSQELTVPSSLSLLIPQDYVNYVSFFRIDNAGVQHPIYPSNSLHQSPQQVPVQDGSGISTQDDAADNLEGTSITNERWGNTADYKISGAYTDQMFNDGIYDWGWEKVSLGQRYGLEPQTSQSNGWFNFNEREGTVMFSSNLANQLIIFNYISDGLSADEDMKVPKMAEEAMYMYMLHAILSSKIGIPEYIINRYKLQKRAALRNAKIRLSNIKLQEIVQVMRGKSKWIKS